MKVALKTRHRAVLVNPMTCTKCGRGIEIGQRYYFWKRRHIGAQYRHAHCGDPREES